MEKSAKVSMVRVGFGGGRGAFFIEDLDEGDSDAGFDRVAGADVRTRICRVRRTLFISGWRSRGELNLGRSRGRGALVLVI